MPALESLWADRNPRRHKFELAGPASGWPDLPPIGRPLPGCQIVLLDVHREPVPRGATGELYVGGDCLSRGYRGRPELTVERFIQIPSDGDGGLRFYRTGDLARRRTDGQFEFLGRVDRQVKIRGYRVEPGETEAILADHPFVAACAVIADKAAERDMTLEAFMVPSGHGSPTPASLREWLGERLPDYMIPSRFIAIPALPVNANGKVDRQALQAADGLELEAGRLYQGPRSETERTLTDVWQTVLGRERVGVTENFFDLGGQSLLAAVICSRINGLLGVEVPVRWLLEHPTIEDLAERLTLH